MIPPHIRKEQSAYQELVQEQYTQFLKKGGYYREHHSAAIRRLELLLLILRHDQKTVEEILGVK